MAKVTKPEYIEMLRKANAEIAELKTKLRYADDEIGTVRRRLHLHLAGKGMEDTQAAPKQDKVGIALELMTAKDAYDKVYKELVTLRHELLLAQYKERSVNEQNIRLQTRVNELQSGALAKKLAATEVQLISTRNNVHALKAHVDELKAMSAQALKNHESIKDSLLSARTSNAALLDDLRKANATVSAKQAVLDEKAKEMAILQDTNNTLSKAQSASLRRIEDLERDCKYYAKEITRVNELLLNMTRACEKWRTKANKIRGKFYRLARRYFKLYANYKQTNDALAKTNTVYLEKLEAIKASEAKVMTLTAELDAERSTKDRSFYNMTYAEIARELKVMREVMHKAANSEQMYAKWNFRV